VIAIPAISLGLEQLTTIEEIKIKNSIWNILFMDKY